MRLAPNCLLAPLGIALCLSLAGCDFTVRPWENTARPAEGLKVKFPDGLKVCKTMSMGYVFNGFSASLSPNPKPCNSDEVDSPYVGSMSIWYEISSIPDQWPYLCRPDFSAPDLKNRLASLKIRNRATFSCVTRAPDGTINFWVFAEAEEPTGQVATYVARLSTDDKNLSQSINYFTELLSSVELSFPPVKTDAATDWHKIEFSMRERYPELDSPSE